MAKIVNVVFYSNNLKHNLVIGGLEKFQICIRNKKIPLRKIQNINKTKVVYKYMTRRFI